MLTTLLRTTLFLTVCGGLCLVSLRKIEGGMPKLSRLLWLAVLLTGWLWMRPILEIPVTHTGEHSLAAGNTMAEEPLPVPVVREQANEFSQHAEIVHAASPPAVLDHEAAAILPAVQAMDRQALVLNAVFAVWIGGMAVTVFLAAAGYARILLLLRKTVPAGDDMSEPWRRLLESHGMDARKIPMRVSNGAAPLGPALIRTVRGYRLVVPKNLWSELSASGKSGILKHELEHFRRRDVWKSLFVRILALPHWFNPLARLAVRRFEELAELQCDRAAFGREKTGAGEFAAMLLILHENTASPFVVRRSIGGSHFCNSAKRRVENLLNDNNERITTMKKILLLTGAAVIFAAMMVKVEFVAQATDNEPGTPTIRMGKEDVLVFGDGKWTNKKTGETLAPGTVVEGTEGRFRLDREGMKGTVVKLSGNGASGTAKHVEFSNGGQAISVSDIPHEEIKKLFKPWTSVIGAETKNPFPGVKATLYFAKNGNVEHIVTTSDAEGRILFPLPSMLNADMEAGTTILVEKDGYVPEQDGRQAKWAERFLNEGKPVCNTFQLQKAEAISGRLVDEDGKSLADVTISVIRQLVKPYGHEGRMRIETFDLKSDSEGRFTIKAAKNEKIVFWAVPEDLAPKFVRSDQKRGDLGDIVVQKGFRPEVKVLDKDGKPVDDVWVNVWRRDEKYTMGIMTQNTRSALTDKDGIARFRPIEEGRYEIRIGERPREKRYNPFSIENSITWRDRQEDKKPVKGVFVFPQFDFSKDNASTTLQAQKTYQVDIQFSDTKAVSERERDWYISISGEQGEGKHYYSRPSSDSPSGFMGDGLYSYNVPVDLTGAILNLQSNTNYSYRVRLEGKTDWIEPKHGDDYPLGPITKDTKIEVAVFKSPKITVDVVDEQGQPVKEYYAWAEYADTKTPATIKFEGDKIRVDRTAEDWHEVNWEFATPELPLVGILDVHFRYKDFGKSEQKINFDGILPGRELRLYLVGKGYEIKSQLVPDMKEGEEKTLTVVLKKSLQRVSTGLE